MNVQQEKVNPTIESCADVNARADNGWTPCRTSHGYEGAIVVIAVGWTCQAVATGAPVGVLVRPIITRPALAMSLMTVSVPVATGSLTINNGVSRDCTTTSHQDRPERRLFQQTLAASCIPLTLKLYGPKAAIASSSSIWRYSRKLSRVSGI